MVHVEKDGIHVQLYDLSMLKSRAKGVDPLDPEVRWITGEYTLLTTEEVHQLQKQYLPAPVVDTMVLSRG